MKRFITLILTILLALTCFNFVACKHEHKFDQKVIKNEYRKTIATCEAPAVYYKSCSCGEKGEETFNATSALGHNYVNRECIRCHKVVATSQYLSFKSIDENTCYLDDTGMCFDRDLVIPSVYGGRTVVSINDEVFEENDNLRTITIPNTITSIGKHAFSGCSNLETVIFAENSQLQVINEGAFEYCYKLTTFTIPEGTVSINRDAFSNCINLEEITMPTSLTTIGEGAFNHCSELEEITIPSNVNNIGIGAFSSCQNLKSFVVENNEYYTSIDGNLYSKDGTTLLQYAIAKQAETFVVPNSVTKIEEKAFYANKNIISITLPSGLQNIGYDAFVDCKNLFEVYNLSSLLITKGSDMYGSVAKNARDIYTSLSAQTKLTKVNDCILYTEGQEKFLLSYVGEETIIEIPAGVTTIEQSAFEYNTYLQSVSLPDSVNTIGEFAFAYCTNLTTVTITKTLSRIEIGAFLGCGRLKNIYYNGTIAEWNNITKGSSWNFSTGIYTITCSDGII